MTPEAIVDVVRSLYGHDARVYVVDYEFAHLVAVNGTHEETVELLGPLRCAVLRLESFIDNMWTWYPIPERDQAVFVVRVPANAPIQSLIDGEPDHVLGAILAAQRHRFDAFERLRRRREMSVAAELQWGLLPVRADSFESLSVAGVLEPAYDVAGDVFDYAWNDEALWAYSFDGMGHGLDATLMSIVAMSAVRNSRRRGDGLAVQMTAAGSALHEQWGGNRFVTGMACRVSVDATEFVNAGHEPARAVVGGQVETLDLRVELPLGVSADHRYRAQSGPRLATGDGIVLFSDGPANARDELHVGLGATRLEAALQDRWSDRPIETAHDIMDDVRSFIGDGRVEDDLTALVVRRTSANR